VGGESDSRTVGEADSYKDWMDDNLGTGVGDLVFCKLEFDGFELENELSKSVKGIDEFSMAGSVLLCCLVICLNCCMQIYRD
jgi:hypothetical protein